MFSTSDINNPWPIQKLKSLSKSSLVDYDSTENNMNSDPESPVTSDDNFVTPVSSAGDLMALSPDLHGNITGDILTGPEFDSICDVTMQDIPLLNDLTFDTDYLVKCSQSSSQGNPNQIDRGKESLFVKFDPLYSRQKQMTFLNQNKQGTDFNEQDVGYETGSAASVVTDSTCAEQMSTGFSQPLSKDKPIQVVPPVKNSDPSKNLVDSKMTPALVRSFSAIMTPTHIATERLINISENSTTPINFSRNYGHNSFCSQPKDSQQTLRHILQKRDQEVLQLLQENRELKASLQDINHKYERQREEFKHEIKKIKDEKAGLQEREQKLVMQLNNKILSHKQMAIAMEEYEKTITSIIDDKQKQESSFKEITDKLTSERDQTLKHLASMESSFNDLLAKYEKCKSIVVEAKEKEKMYELKISEYEKGISKVEDSYNKLKEITTEKLNKANETLDGLKKKHNAEIIKLNALNKKHEVTILSLQESLTQKTRDNENLTRICDQLINNVN